MKKAKDYLGNVNTFTTREELYNIGRQIQEDAIRETVKECSKNISIKWNADHAEINKERFFSVADKLIKEL